VEGGGEAVEQPQRAKTDAGGLGDGSGSARVGVWCEARSTWGSLACELIAQVLQHSGGRHTRTGEDLGRPVVQQLSAVWSEVRGRK
jgi:hypothetical protein